MRKENAVAQLIENKRKHLQKQLSSSQRDMILFSEPREDLNTQKEMVRLMRESSQSFWNAIEGVWDSIKEISSSISKSVDLLAQSLAQPPQRQLQEMSGSYTVNLMSNLYRTNFEQSFNQTLCLCCSELVSLVQFFFHVMRQCKSLKNYF